MSWSSGKEWTRDHKLTVVVIILMIIFGVLATPGMPRFFHWDSAAQSMPGATSPLRPKPNTQLIDQPAQQSPVPGKGPALVESESNRTARTSDLSQRTPKLSIVYPKRDLDPVGPDSKVTIEYRNIPLSQYLWLVVETPEGGSWPHGRCDPQNLSDAGPSLIERQVKTGIWDTPKLQKIHFGGDKELKLLPLRFTIHLVAVDEEENKRLMGVVREKCPHFEGQATYKIRFLVGTKRVVLRTS